MEHTQEFDGVLVNTGSRLVRGTITYEGANCSFTPFDCSDLTDDELQVICLNISMRNFKHSAQTLRQDS